MGTGSQAGSAEGEAASAAVPADSEAAPPQPIASGPSYTPLFKAQNEDRYRRQAMIRQYEEEHGCRLVVMIDQITADISITLFAELLHDVPGDRDLHLMLCSPGGDGEAAIRLARMAQAACKDLVVLVPEMAKSAATILALGADRLIMGATSDLGPIDPQVLVANREYVSAKDLIAGVDRALKEVNDRPDSYALMSAMLGGIDVTQVEFARSALDRTGDIARQALASNPHRTKHDIQVLYDTIKGPLIEEPRSHGAVIGAPEARRIGLPVQELDHTDPQWRAIWALWTSYFVLGHVGLLQVYEGTRASQVHVHRI